MIPTFWQRIAEWLCRYFGHWSKMNRDDFGDAEEVCRVCGHLLSTRYSRERRGQE